ncbi:MAG: LuxR C-terminal-related transcriptional regulator [Solirubrobacteraceae bacterium]|nr:LuxR C-terminal-related transcriptional regulator [Solirubrobacteraceae bacterium]
MAGAVDHIERGRAFYASRAWTDAHESLSRADRVQPLAAEDLESLATSAYMLGRDADYVSAMERAYQAHLDGGAGLRAARCAFWIAINLILRGKLGGATGWLGRARRLVEGQEGDCVERGYLLLADMFAHEAAGDLEAAAGVAAQATAIGASFGEMDLHALAAQDQGLLLIELGRVVEGLALLDEAMVAVTAGELSPMINGFVYCGVITGCRAAHEPRRAQEWTEALAAWCEQQPDLVSFTGTCLVHRAEIMALHGAWPEALGEARRAAERCALASNVSTAAQARYVQGEIHRLRGEFAAAEEAYRDARRGGCDPQPGLALLRLAQGDGDVAAAAIGRLVEEALQPAQRVRMLPACVEIMLAIGDVPAARRAGDELQALAERWTGPMLAALAAHARGAVELADGDARAALVALRRADETWRALDAPYEAARARRLIARCCRALGDDDSAALELDEARAAFERLGAAPDLDLPEERSTGTRDGATHGLTPRELQVLRLVAAGRSNREVAGELVISQHTVARHLQNIFAKLGVASRTAASAFAHAHGLL